MAYGSHSLGLLVFKNKLLTSDLMWALAQRPSRVLECGLTPRASPAPPPFRSQQMNLLSYLVEKSCGLTRPPLEPRSTLRPVPRAPRPHPSAHPASLGPGSPCAAPGAGARERGFSSPSSKTSLYVLPLGPSPRSAFLVPASSLCHHNVCYLTFSASFLVTCWEVSLAAPE